MTIEVPFKKDADFEHLRKVIMRETTDGPVPILELTVDDEMMAEATDFDFPKGGQLKLLNASREDAAESVMLGIKYMDLCLTFSQTVGYDYATMFPIVPVPLTPQQMKENPVQDDKIRGWQNEHGGLISSRKDFEEFPWPGPDQIVMFPLDYAGGKMPDGMKAMTFYMGIFENLRSLMGFEDMAIKSIDEPDLLNDILDKLTELAVIALEQIATHPATGAVFYADDLGFNTSTMLSPTWMRENLIPRYKRFADICHKHDKPFLFHSCGQIDAIMEDLIEEVGIDARHSFEDIIEPVEEVYKKYGDRIAILGGVDVDLLSRGTEEDVRARTRQILEVCAPGGGYCMGSGNSVANYCKIENYYAMIDETRRWNEEHA